MIFGDAIFLLLLTASVFAYYICPKGWKAYALITASIIFYALYASYFVLLLLAEAVVVYVLAKNIQKKGVLLSGILLTLALLAYFKYRWMFVGSFATLLSLTYQGFSAMQKATVPLAISFFTFGFIHYIVDSARKTIPKHNFKDFLLFTVFFPTIVAGPIKRFQDFKPQTQTANRFDPANMYYGIARIVAGLFKKIVLADMLVLWTDKIFTVENVLRSNYLNLWVAIFAFSLKIYFDFSGYSDIAIGSSRLFGIRIMENFNWPYLKRNISQFWQNWHISLYKWIIDYIFNPFYTWLMKGRLGRMKSIVLGSNIGIILGILVTWLLSGLWHGASWSFVLWGLYHAILLITYRLYTLFIKPKICHYRWYNTALAAALFTLVTFVLVSLGWIFFTQDARIPFAIIKRLFFIK